MKAENLEHHFATLFSHAPELGKDCLRFAQNWCDVSTYTDPDNEGRPFYLKRLARLLGNSMGLASWVATAENTLLVDDSPYKNVLNDPYNVVHPLTFTYFMEKSMKKKPYLTHQLWPFLKDLKDSGLPIPVYSNNKACLVLCGYFQEIRSMSVLELLFLGIRGDSMSHSVAPIFRELLTRM
jgi:hypothetical protein